MNGISPVARSESGAERISRFLGNFLARWGVDATQYHCLLLATLKMDFRSTHTLQGQGGQTKSALRTTVLLNLVFSGLMSLLFAHMTETFFFAVILLGYAMAMLAMMILMEFGLAVISPDDHLILAHRPISSRTFLAVRFSNLLFYVLILDLSLSIVPAFAGLLCRGSPWFFPFVYLPVSIGAGIFVAGAVVAFYGFLVRWFNYDKFKDLLVYCQILLSFLFFFGYQLIPRLAGELRGVDTGRLTHGWGALFPSVWFASLVEWGLGHWSTQVLITGAVGLILTCVVMPVMFKSISLDYSENIGRMITGSAKPKAAVSANPRAGRLTRSFARVFLRDTEERAFFTFVVTMFKRNRHLKLQLYPNFGVMIAMFVLAVMDHKKLSDPLSGQGDPGIVVSFSAMAFVFGAVGLANLLPYSDEYSGGWIFHVAPVRKPEAILAAVKKGAVLFLFLPLLILDVALFSFLWPPLHAFELGLYGFLIGLIVFQIVLFQFHGFPFTRKPEKGSQSRQFTVVMMLLSVVAVMVLLPLLLSRSQTIVEITCAVLIVINVILNRWNSRVFAKREIEPG